jgi:tetratricopeptide (TPR) repeat protein
VYYLASAYQSTGRLDDAVAFYDKALELGSGDLPSMVHLGDVYLEQNRVDEAEKLFRRALSMGGRCAACLTGLGQVAMAGREFAQAAEHFEAALSLIPEANRLHYLLAMAYRGAGETEKARAHLARSGPVGARVKDPLLDDLNQLKQGERAHLLRGRLAFRFGHYEEAAVEFKKAVDADSTSYRARVNLGTALGELDDIAGAIEQYSEALKLSPDGATANYNLGFLLAQKGRYDEAIPHFEATLKKQPKDHQAHFALAEALKEKGDIEKAWSHYSSATRIKPDFENARLGESGMLVRGERYKEAIAVLDEALERFPRDGRTAHTLARLLVSCPDETLRDGERALALAQRVFEVSKTVTHVETVAMALAELGRCEEAAQWQRSAITTAEREGRKDLVEWYRKALLVYERGAPCRPKIDMP